MCMSMLAYNDIFLRIPLFLRTSHLSRVPCLARRVLLHKEAAAAGAGAEDSSVCTELRNEGRATANVERKLLGYIANTPLHDFTSYHLICRAGVTNLEPSVAQADISGVTGDYIICSKHYLARFHNLTV